MAMTPWLHFGNSDYLIFKSWQPSSHGAIAGACVGLFLFCILERCLVAYRRSQEARWRARLSYSVSCKEGDVEGPVPTRKRLAPPFVLSQDIVRGVTEAFQSIFSYSLMLAVMTFNASYIISIIIGRGIGEVLFGRMGRR